MLCGLQGARHAFADQMGRNAANPTAMLLCAAKMLHHLNLDYHCDLITKAVEKTIKDGKVEKIPFPV